MNDDRVANWPHDDKMREPSVEEVEAEAIVELPHREAMSLVDPGFSTMPALDGTPTFGDATGLGGASSLGNKLIGTPNVSTSPVEPPT